MGCAELNLLFVEQPLRYGGRKSCLKWNGIHKIQHYSQPVTGLFLNFEFLWSGNQLWVCHSWQQEMSYGEQSVTNYSNSL